MKSMVLISGITEKKHLIDCLLNSYCDIFFFQEITKTQFMYIDKYLNSAYEFVGVYRDSTDASEKCSISYNIFKYTLTDWGQFWLSSTLHFYRSY